MFHRQAYHSILRWWQSVLLGVLLLLIVCGMPQVQGQDNSQKYRFVQPKAADYSEKAEAILAKAKTGYAYFEERTGTTEFETLSDEMFWRLVEQHQINYQQMIKIYRTLASSKQAQNTASDDRFIPHLIELWLAENPTNLYTTSTLSFDDFQFEVRPFQNTAMYTLIMRKAPFDSSALYHTGLLGGGSNYVAVRDEQDKYLVPDLPVPMFSGVLQSGDLNGDGQPDFAYLNYSHAGNSYTILNLYIVTLAGEKFQTLDQVEFRSGPVGSDPVLTWNFAQFDDDKAQELMTTQLFYDNWGCDFIRVTYYDWQKDGTLNSESAQDNLPKSFNCLLRQAEQELWKKEYTDAADLYQQAFAKSGGDAPFRYLGQIHFGLVDLLTGNKPHARLLFSSLNIPSEDQKDYSWVEAIKQAYLNDPRLLPVCQAIYDQGFNFANPYLLSGTVYISDGGFYGPSSYDPGLNLEDASCDLPAIMQDELAKVRFSTVQTPVEQLLEAGLKVKDFIKADFDQDGDDDWVVWADSIGIDPMLFIADGSEYTRRVLSGRGSGDIYLPSADMRQPDLLNQYRIIHLPDGHLALMNIDFGHDIYAETVCYMCGGGPPITCAENEYAPDPARGKGDLTLWRLEGGQLTSFFFAQLCGWGYQANLFPDGEGGQTLLAGDEFATSSSQEDGSSEIRQVIYTWDENTHTYVASPQPPMTLIPTPTLASTPVSQNASPLYVGTFMSMHESFAKHDYQRVLEMIDAALAQEKPSDPSLVTTFHYYRALTLEALQRPDGALKEYIAIYEAEPDSAWGMMAALHLEKIG